LHRKEKGETSHLIYLNGCQDMGMWGYIQCFEDIRQQVSQSASHLGSQLVIQLFG